MKLSTVFSQLEISELNQLSCVDQVTGKIRPDKYQAIIDVMNQGLVDLHTRFKLKIGQAIVPIDPAIEVYDLTKFDRSIRGRFLQIHDIKDEHGRALEYNGFSERSVSFMNSMTMLVPEYLRRVHPLRQVTVQYRALPTKIGSCWDTIEPEEIEVDLPQAYMWALCLYVASRLHTPVGLNDGTYQPNAFLGLFNAECNRLEETGLDLDYQKDNSAIRRNGWA